MRYLFAAFTSLLLLPLWLQDANAQESVPDARIVFIDTNYFAALQPDQERRRAIDYLLQDLDRIDRDAPVAQSGSGTLLLLPDDGTLSPLGPIPVGVSVRDSFAASAEYVRMLTGQAEGNEPVDVFSLRDQIYGSFRVLGVRRRGERVIDLHVFAAAWQVSRPLREAQLMEYNQATECLLARGSNPFQWPQNVELRVEFRTPAGESMPSPSAQAALIGLITVFSTEERNILNRGPVGPLCQMQEGTAQAGFIEDRMRDNLRCDTLDDLQRLSETLPIAPVCRAPAPIAPSVGEGLDRGPVSILSRPDIVVLSDAGLTGDLARDVPLTAQIGGSVLAPGQSPGTIGGSGSDSEPVTLHFDGTGSCDVGATGDIEIGSEGQVARLSITNHHCREAERDMGSVALP